MAGRAVSAAGLLLVFPVAAAVSIASTLVLHGAGGRPDLLPLVGIAAIFAIGQPQALYESGAAMLGLSVFAEPCICEASVTCAVERGTAEAAVAGVWPALVPSLIVVALVWRRRVDVMCVAVAGLIAFPLHAALTASAGDRLAEHRANACNQNGDEGAQQ